MVGYVFGVSDYYFALTMMLVVEIDLRLPSMLHGKKGFDRIEHAFKNVLTNPVTWLFHDLGVTRMSTF